MPTKLLPVRWPLTDAAACLVLALLLCGTSVTGPDAVASRGGPAPDIASAARIEPLAPATPSLCDDVGRAFPSLVRSLATTSDFAPATWEVAGRPVAGLVALPSPAEPVGLVPSEGQAWLAAARREITADGVGLRLFFPQRFNDGFAVRAGGLTVWSLPLGATSARAEIDHGRLVYREAYPHTSVIHTAAAERGEEFLLLSERAAPTRFTYLLGDASGDLRVVTDGRGGLRISDQAGHALGIEAPWMVDATGTVSATAVRWQVDAARGDGRQQVSLLLDARGLTYPLVIDPTWAATGAMVTDRYYHTATLLPSGKVLVTSGYWSGASTGLTSCELYDPALGTWSATGSLTTWRGGHTATLLPSGKVLVAGGFGGSSSLASCELYDPALGTWSATGSMLGLRAAHTATLLPSGKVLVTGGDGGGYVNTCELYDPALGTWSATGSMGGAREEHSATLLPSGKVLVVGGAVNSYSDPGNSLATCELYDPALGTWSATGALGTARYYHAVALLASGKVLVGGGYVGTTYLASCELYDPALGTWSATGAMGHARERHTATVLPSGLVVAVGGAINLYSNHPGDPLATCELYDPTAGTWTATSPLTAARYDHTATLLGAGTVLVAGGLGLGSSLASCQLLNSRAPAITWAAPAAITYGSALSATELDATADVAGTFAYAPAAGTVLGAGAQTLGATFTPADGVAFDSATASVPLTVSKALPVIAWTAPTAITYGTALSATELDATVTVTTGGTTHAVSGTLTYTPAAGTVLGAGAGQILSVHFVPDDTVNYATPADATVALTVAKALPVITWTAPAAITYGTSLSATQLDATVAVTTGGTTHALAGTLTYSPTAGTVLGAGAGQVLSVHFVPNDTVDYATPADATVALTVTKATATVTLSALAATFDGAAHAITVTTVPAGLGVTVTYAGGGAPSAIGSYTVVATVNDANYSGTANGTLVISAASTGGGGGASGDGGGGGGGCGLGSGLALLLAALAVARYASTGRTRTPQS